MRAEEPQSTLNSPGNTGNRLSKNPSIHFELRTFKVSSSLLAALLRLVNGIVIDRSRRRRIPSGFTYISGCVKYTMFFFNFIFWLMGLLLIGVR